ncbi:MAG TPA: CoA-binding protein [Ilumatobacteraceae bacterium]
MSSWHNPTARERLDIIRSTSSVAIVGMSADTSRASYFVATYLVSSSCEFEDIWFVNPKGGEVLGRPMYPSLAELPGVPDLVDVFRRTDDLPSVAKEFVAIPGTKTFWCQLGLYSAEAVDIVTEAGRTAVMNRCFKIEHARFRGGLHMAGFDTGVISSRRAPLL